MVSKTCTFFRDGRAMTCPTDGDGKQIAIIGTALACVSALWGCIPGCCDKDFIYFSVWINLASAFAAFSNGCMIDVFSDGGNFVAFVAAICLSAFNIVCAIVVGVVSIVSIPLVFATVK